MQRLVFTAPVLVCASIVMAAPLDYHEHWDSYNLGTGDATYQAAWPTVSLPGYVRFNLVDSNVFTPPRAIEYPGANQKRGIINNLADGVSSGQPDAIEMSPGQWVVPTADSELDLSLYMRIQTGNQRKNVNGIVVLSMGDQDANIPTDTTTVLANPIPALAFGVINGWGDANNTAPYFFNGQQWIQTSLGVTTGYNRLWMNIRSDGNVLVEERSQGQSSLYAAVYTGGFDTISVRVDNILNPSGANRIEDIYLSGGNVVPEPTTAGLLALGALGLLRRRRF
jgi:hypothetical protein